MLLMFIGCARQFRQNAGAQRARLFRTTDRDCFEFLACGKGGGRSRARAEVSSALYKVELIRRRALGQILAKLPRLASPLDAVDLERSGVGRISG